MSGQKVVAYRWKGSTVWQDGSGPKGQELDYVNQYQIAIEYAYSQPAPDPLLEQMAEALRAFVYYSSAENGDVSLIDNEALFDKGESALSAYDARRKP